MSTASFSDLGALFAPSFFYNMQGVLKFLIEKKNSVGPFQIFKSERVVARGSSSDFHHHLLSETFLRKPVLR